MGELGSGVELAGEICGKGVSVDVVVMWGMVCPEEGRYGPVQPLASSPRPWRKITVAGAVGEGDSYGERARGERWSTCCAEVEYIGRKALPLARLRMLSSHAATSPRPLPISHQSSAIKHSNDHHPWTEIPKTP